MAKKSESQKIMDRMRKRDKWLREHDTIGGKASPHRKKKKK